MSPLPEFNDNPSNHKNKLLTQSDVDAYDCNPAVLRVVEWAAKRLNKSPSALRILDYGCGRGEMLAHLRGKGYACYGVDIEMQYIENAKAYFGADDGGFPAVSLISRNVTVFPDGYFDVVITDQVLEHVKEIRPVIEEMRRIMGPDAVALHIFPSAYSLVEVHMFLPVCHWLPKNAFRYAAIYAMLALGMGAPFFKELSTRDRARVFFQFSITDTYYRPNWLIDRVFGENYLFTRQLARQKLLWRGGTVAKIAAIPLLGSLTAWMYSTFHQSYLLASRERAVPQ